MHRDSSAGSYWCVCVATVTAADGTPKEMFVSARSDRLTPDYGEAALHERSDWASDQARTTLTQRPDVLRVCVVEDYGLDSQRVVSTFER